MIFSYIPEELIHKVLEYDGRIKYRKGKYVDIIHKNDERYNMITPILNKKLKIFKTAEVYGDGFYFEFGFNINQNVGLCYDYNFSFPNKFEICYYDMRYG